MRDLWRRTKELFWEYPSLWIPVLVADLAGFWAAHLLKVVSSRLFSQIIVAIYRPVIGTTPEMPSQAMTFLISTITGLIYRSGDFLRILLYAVAFLVTKQLVEQVLSTNGVPRLQSVEWRLLRMKAAAIFSLKIFVLASAVGILVAAVAMRVYRAQYQAVWSSLVALIVMIVLAYVMVPAGLKLIKTNQETTGEQRATARSLSFVAITISLGISLFAVTAGPSFVRPRGVVPPLFFDMVASLLVALPYAALFIALALLVVPVRTDKTTA